MSAFAGTTVEIRVVISKGGGQEPLVLKRVTEAITDEEMKKLRAAVTAGLISRLPEGSLLVTLSEHFGYGITTSLPPEMCPVLQELTRALHATMRQIYRRLHP